MLPNHVKLKPKIFEFIPGFSKSAFTIFPYIFLPKTTYKDLQSTAPSVFSMATLAHEQVHWEREKQIGILLYAAKYLALPKFRLQEELIAIKPQMAIIKQAGEKFDVEKRAKQLSGFDYLFCTNYNSAKAQLNNLWVSINCGIIQ